MMEGTCFLCFYRIHSGQDSVSMKVGDRWRPVHRHHEAERKIKITRYPYNVYEEYMMEEAEIL
jgi:hypothetical protein